MPNLEARGVAFRRGASTRRRIVRRTELLCFLDVTLGPRRGCGERVVGVRRARIGEEIVGSCAEDAVRRCPPAVRDAVVCDAGPEDVRPPEAVRLRAGRAVRPSAGPLNRSKSLTMRLRLASFSERSARGCTLGTVLRAARCSGREVVCRLLTVLRPRLLSPNETGRAGPTGQRRHPHRWAAPLFGRW